MAHLELFQETPAGVVPLADEGLTFLAEKDRTLKRVGSRAEGAQAALLRTTHGWVLLDYTGSQTQLNGLRVADFKRAREGDQIQIGEVVVRLLEIRRETLRPDSDILQPHDAESVICRVDGRGFEVGEEVVYCPACNAPHHADCWIYNEESCAAGAHCDYRKP